MEAVTLHATAVAFGTRCALIRGAAGRGKSTLALDLICRGGMLVSDDRTRVALVDGRPVASAPDTIAGRIEARGIGILRVAVAPPTIIGLIVDLDHAETERLPVERTDAVLGIAVPLLRAVEHPRLAAAIALILAGAELVRS